MAISTRLGTYLALERQMVALDLDSDPLADDLRDRMDVFWYALTDTERALLDARTGDPMVFAGTIGAGEVGVVASHGG